jgi:hypothetical protein
MVFPPCPPVVRCPYPTSSESRLVRAGVGWRGGVARRRGGVGVRRGGGIRRGWGRLGRLVGRGGGVGWVVGWVVGRGGGVGRVVGWVVGWRGGVSWVVGWVVSWVGGWSGGVARRTDVAATEATVEERGHLGPGHGLVGAVAPGRAALRDLGAHERLDRVPVDRSLDVTEPGGPGGLELEGAGQHRSHLCPGHTLVGGEGAVTTPRDDARCSGGAHGAGVHAAAGNVAERGVTGGREFQDAGEHRGGLVAAQSDGRAEGAGLAPVDHPDGVESLDGGGVDRTLDVIEGPLGRSRGRGTEGAGEQEGEGDDEQPGQGRDGTCADGGGTGRLSIDRHGSAPGGTRSGRPGWYRRGWPSPYVRTGAAPHPLEPGLVMPLPRMAAREVADPGPGSRANSGPTSLRARTALGSGRFTTVRGHTRGSSVPVRGQDGDVAWRLDNGARSEGGEVRAVGA